MDSITLMDIHKYNICIIICFWLQYVACMCDKMLHLNTEQQRLEQVMEAMLTFKTTKSFEEINDACLF